MSAAKARISKTDEKGSDTGEFFYVQFNPNEISINEYVGQFAQKKVHTPLRDRNAAQQTPAGLQAAPGNEQKGITFSTKLFFNTYNSAADCGDVREHIKKFDSFLNKTAQTDKAIYFIRFKWGSIDIFGRLTSMNISYTMFSSEGNPVRAEASISITGDYVQYKPSEVPTETEQTFESASESLGFADALGKYYEDIDKLKTAASENGVVNLRTLE